MFRQIVVAILGLFLYTLACAQTWNGANTWDIGFLGPSDGQVEKLAAMRVAGDGVYVFAGGDFSDVAGVPNTRAIARWHTDHHQWHDIPWSITSREAVVRDLIVWKYDGSKEVLVIAGNFEFTTPHNGSGEYIAFFDGQDVYPISTFRVAGKLPPSDPNASTHALELVLRQPGAPEKDLCVAGNFSSIAGLNKPTDHRFVACKKHGIDPKGMEWYMWDDGNAPGLNERIVDITSRPKGQEIFAIGDFSEVPVDSAICTRPGLRAVAIASQKRNSSAWVSVGCGLEQCGSFPCGDPRNTEPFPNSLEIHDGLLWVTGNDRLTPRDNSANPMSRSPIIRWRLAAKSWDDTPQGGITDRTVYRTYKKQNDLYVGGSFTVTSPPRVGLLTNPTTGANAYGLSRIATNDVPIGTVKDILITQYRGGKCTGIFIGGSFTASQAPAGNRVSQIAVSNDRRTNCDEPLPPPPPCDFEVTKEYESRDGTSYLYHITVTKVSGCEEAGIVTITDNAQETNTVSVAPMSSVQDCQPTGRFSFECKRKSGYLGPGDSESIPVVVKTTGNNQSPGGRPAVSMPPRNCVTLELTDSAGNPVQESNIDNNSDCYDQLEPQPPVSDPIQPGALKRGR